MSQPAVYCEDDGVQDGDKAILGDSVQLVEEHVLTGEVDLGSEED